MTKLNNPNNEEGYTAAAQPRTADHPAAAGIIK